jgi:hypothetical protein
LNGRLIIAFSDQASRLSGSLTKAKTRAIPNARKVAWMSHGREGLDSQMYLPTKEPMVAEMNKRSPWA